MKFKHLAAGAAAKEAAKVAEKAAKEAVRAAQVVNGEGRHA